MSWEFPVDRAMYATDQWNGSRFSNPAASFPFNKEGFA